MRGHTDAPVCPALKRAEALPVTNGFGRHSDRRSRLAPQRRRRRFCHVDPIGRVEDLDIQRADARMPCELTFDRESFADQQESGLEMARSHESATHDAPGASSPPSRR